MWHQLQEVLALNPQSVLEVGAGSGTFKAVATSYGVNVKTVDIDPELKPDYIASATTLPFGDGTFDVSCAFQVLEHMPFTNSMAALSEISRVTRNALVISLPDAKTCWPNSIRLPKIGLKEFVIPRPLFKPQEHIFDGQHYWEINKKDYTLEYVTESMLEASNIHDYRTYRVHNNPYHRFFIFLKTTATKP
jgi:ubiquinone/menaquinone biosynthesis C-methylase UbiE